MFCDRSVIGTKELRTVVALEAELIRLKCEEARVVPEKDAPYRKVAAHCESCRGTASSSGWLEVLYDGAANASE